MTYTFTPLSKDQIDNLFSEINGLLEAELRDEPQAKIGNQKPIVLPTTEVFDKAEVLKCLRILEPNSVIFFQDLQVSDQILVLLSTAPVHNESVQNATQL